MPPRLALLLGDGQPQAVRDRGRLDGDRLRLLPPDPAAHAVLVPDPAVPVPLRVPGHRQRLAARRVSDHGPALGHLCHHEQAAAAIRDRPAVGALGGAVQQQQLRVSGRVLGRAQGAVLLAQLVAEAGRQHQLELRLQQLEPRRHVLQRDQRRALGRGDPHRDVDRAVIQRDRALDLQPVTLPGHRRPGSRDIDHRPGVVGRAAVKAVVPGSVDAAVAGVGQHRLPAAAVRGRPPVLVQVAAQDRLRAERRAAEQLAAGDEVDQVEDLAAVLRIDPHQQLG